MDRIWLQEYYQQPRGLVSKIPARGRRQRFCHVFCRPDRILASRSALPAVKELLKHVGGGLARVLAAGGGPRRQLARSLFVRLFLLLLRLGLQGLSFGR